MTKFARLVVLLMSLSLAACQGAVMRTLKAPHVFSPYQKTTLSYGAHTTQKLDVYRPTDKKLVGKTLPMIVFYFWWQLAQRQARVV